MINRHQGKAQIIQGRVAWKFDDFFPGDHVLGREGWQEKNRDPDCLKHYVLTWLDPKFSRRFRPGDLMVAGRAFGGTRDHGSVMALKALGVAVVLAESFGRVWRRRAISYALPVLMCPGIYSFTRLNDELIVDLQSGWVSNLTTEQEIQGIPAIKPQLSILRAGSLTGYIRNRMAETD